MNLASSSALAFALSLVCGVAAPAQVTHEQDMTDLLKPPPSLTVAKGAKVGFRLEAKITAGPRTMNFCVAIVGETKDAWEIESNQYSIGMGLTMALVVDKASGEVLIARAGKPGEALREIKIGEQPKQAQQKKPSEVDVIYTLPSGKEVDATKTLILIDGKTYAVWTGSKGSDLEGLELKKTLPNEARELAEDPSKIEFELTDLGPKGKPRTLAAQRLVYTDESEVVMTRDPVVGALGYGLLATRNKGGSFKVVSVRTDAKKTLSWK